MSTACITGASSGIGRQMAIELSKRGYNLILIARNTEKLQKIAGKLPTKCKIICCDLSDENACIRLGQELSKMNIEVFINNAGFGDLGVFAHTDLQKDMNMINVNVKAMHILTKLMLPAFIRRDSGYIMNVASVAGLMPAGPYMASYYASKAYIASLTTSIHQELKEQKSHVHISLLCPGPVDTNFNDTANVKFCLPGISASYCAKYALRRMFRKKMLIIPSFVIKAAAFSVRFAPRQTAAAFAAKQQHKKF